MYSNSFVSLVNMMLKILHKKVKKILPKFKTENN